MPPPCAEGATPMVSRSQWRSPGCHRSVLAPSRTNPGNERGAARATASIMGVARSLRRALQGKAPGGSHTATPSSRPSATAASTAPNASASRTVAVKNRRSTRDRVAGSGNRWRNGG
jgi:hypothetical protein